MDKVIVVGGGPAGLLAAATAASFKGNVTLLEKNKEVGKKLLLTGNGRCNVTNTCDMEEHIANVVHNKEFLYSAFYTFTNNDLINLLHKLGVKTKEEKGGRVFPLTDKAIDVVKALKKYAEDNGVEIQYSSPVNSVITQNGKVKGVLLENGAELLCDKVIIATGGKSYPKTGSTGDGYKIAEELGHKIIEPKPALTPLVIKEPWVKELQGLALKGVELTLWENKRQVFSETGDMLFTHYGISGPLVLSISGHIKDLKVGNYQIVLNLFPHLSEKELDVKLQELFTLNSRKIFINSLEALLPKRMAEIVVKGSKIPGDKGVNQISREERNNLVKFLQSLTLTPVNLRGFSEAMVTAGGIDVKEVNPSTMESKLVKGLYFAGEVLDVDAYTGGFNLQIAFSTGYLAGASNPH
ncbi:hypothetical protein SAMN02745227_00520 [Anaerobranca californiensis DSM 14826]|jgi:predicted Rossmann fold flavoprotein|uniref:Aminoacetone oxidase family FAD-binding enzyme n=1 Tax=Anaerobranca californiensis DSM 14826 TaxID=1120989 RepID=A0A1M6LI84_9FIRM|nr:NAD(P)/FAD-dependent oxidoreductase [Anaerobranca californiensis]SHJ70887.1 hypothetical protein SAMN02745227_00520 [Anaerobranca californiensis DSM 14826]